MRDERGRGRFDRGDVQIVPGKGRNIRDSLLADRDERGRRAGKDRTSSDALTTLSGDAWNGRKGRGWDREDRGFRWSSLNEDPSRFDYSPFRDKARELRVQAQNEGWDFDERDYRYTVYDYAQREWWRENLLRSVISINIGYPMEYYYIPPPAYPYYGVTYDPWYYNVGYTYYYPEFNSFYVAPYSYAYMPFDPFYASYYYYDPYDIDDRTDDFLTVRIFASTAGTGFLSRLVGGLIAYGYDQGYRDGLLARQAGYGYDHYSDPFIYYNDEPYYEDVYVEESTYYSFYEPYSYSVYENRRALSEGYELGYRDALYGYAEYDPYAYAGRIDLVSIYVGTTFQLV